MIGALLGSKYRLLQLLGQGGMGSVYEAADETSGARYIKVLHAEILREGSSKDDTSKLTRFQREAKAAAAVQSAHIARVLDWGTDDATSQPFMVMDLLRGEDLQQLKRAPVLAPNVVLRIAVQACQGLVDAHDARVMHRDIKPANLFLARDGAGLVSVKLLDFGIAKFRPEGEEAGETTNLTRTGSMLGSPRYMSPEQARGIRALDHRTDLWSLGVVMYRALTGHMPHEDAEAMGDFIVLLCSEPPRSIRKHAPWVPAEIIDLVESALQIDREKRYPDARAMLEALRALTPAGAEIRESELVALPESARGARPPVPRTVGAPGASASSPGFDNSNDATVPLGTARTAGLQPSRDDAVTIRRDDNGTPGPLANTQSDTGTGGRTRPRRTVVPFVLGAAVLVAGIGAVAVLRGTEQASDGDPAPTAAPSGGAASATAAPVPMRRANLVIFPEDAAVEINGAAVTSHNGVVELAGKLGSVHRVRLSRDGQEKTIEVVLGEAGPEPPKVELPAPAPTASASSSAAAAPVLTGRVPPPSKTVAPAVSTATKTKNPLIPEKFE
ncbi:MAG: serine/threonine-protein kinase [Polyangiaceae bacterium]